MRRLTVVLAAAVVVFGLACGAALAAGPQAGWSWLLGDLTAASIGQLTGGSDLFVGAYYGGSVPVEISGEQIEDSDAGGYFELEHSWSSPDSVLLAQTQAGNPTPMTVGKADGQDLTPLIVSGEAGMTDDLQSWQLGGGTPAAIDAKGRLRVNGIVLEPRTTKGGIELDAVLPDGSTQLLVPVR